ncbi:dual specificity phosphatase catalytic domain protein [Ophiostoma piceae UAMH 11346]|uniref:Dual specificity phosphatase catalytic domain protein n=1 Tax=Ophiostoma piceae (strain UAMH 11346) TaxID=1262450 RepID=S3CFR5_OPHP1|nr:dual specificity phosphatase catalytic domain protein [Ophiostoma piceae UAMH 11346]
MASDPYDSHTSDPPLLRRHSSFVKVETQAYTYPSVRVFFKRHEQQDQMPVDPAPLPLLVFIHGLGGSISQFTPLLTRLSSCASCLAVDLPGCGRSSFAPQAWDAYSSDRLLDLLESVIALYRQPEQGLVLIGHSMGCSLAASLVSRQSSQSGDARPGVGSPYTGLVAICPSAGIHGKGRAALFRTLLWIPTPIFDMMRAWDGRGGLNSAGVCRFVGEEADEDSKLLQLKFNKQSKTPVWRRMAWGCLPVFDASGSQIDGLAGEHIWRQLDLPVCLIAGDADHVTPPSQTHKIASFLQTARPTKLSATFGPENDDTQLPSDATSLSTPEATTTMPAPIPDSATAASRPGSTGYITNSQLLDGPSTHQAAAVGGAPSTPAVKSTTINIPAIHRHPPKFVEYHVLPAPANHALLYVSTTVGVVSGIVANFLARHVSHRLDRGWQLRFLSREGKWDVKNLQKWTKVQPVSEPIAGVFHAMKTLRQVDNVHSPHVFVSAWSGIVTDVIDISHDNPVYDPRDLERGGIHYHKFPTVSKIPPTDFEVDVFNSLVDKIRVDHKRPKQKPSECTDGSPSQGYIGVHCHYGFNRTGYFIVCYLVDRCGYTLRDAISTFAEARPVGIRHSHFIDALSLRYAKVLDAR